MGLSDVRFELWPSAPDGLVLRVSGGQASYSEWQETVLSRGECLELVVWLLRLVAAQSDVHPGGLVLEANITADELQANAEASAAVVLEDLAGEEPVVLPSLSVREAVAADVQEPEAPIEGREIEPEWSTTEFVVREASQESTAVDSPEPPTSGLESRMVWGPPPATDGELVVEPVGRDAAVMPFALASDEPWPQYACVECGKDCRNAAGLASHRKTHGVAATEPKSLRCSACWRDFETATALAVHACDPSSTVGCAYCDRRFTPQGLGMHMKAFHPDARPWRSLPAVVSDGPREPHRLVRMVFSDEGDGWAGKCSCGHVATPNPDRAAARESFEVHLRVSA